ncbi:hypothetical protein QYE76_013503 [Lolium multiflorum]|uniref:F-box domain-containing protein n=1 Tax=Lolium multiflorum TaxID=4521 RepID=A0AAD8U0T4_LOLMU|nr:hypothetical protein QYE76_013503 [Lolium multiflorum]
MSESEGAGTRRRLAGASPATPASPFEVDDLLREILLRLPPRPSSLPCASAVCTRWRGLVADPKFLRLFRAHHRKPPLLGIIEHGYQGVQFIPILDPPDRIPPERFHLGPCSRGTDVLDCRHGLVLVHNRVSARTEVLVCDPVAGEQRHVPIPLELDRYILNGAVLCSASEQGHVHGSCHSSPFKVVLVGKGRNGLMACVYSSQAGIWGNLITTAATFDLFAHHVPATLIGNALYWLPFIDRIVEFDLDGHNLAVIGGPPVTCDLQDGSSHIIQFEDGAVGLAILSYTCLQMWHRNVDRHGVATWVLWKTIETQNILGRPWTKADGAIMGYSQDTDDLFIYLEPDAYMLHLKSMQSKILPGSYQPMFKYHPFTSFYYTPGTTIRGCDEADMLQKSIGRLSSLKG